MEKKPPLRILLSLFFFFSVKGLWADSPEVETIRALDAQWERALLYVDIDALEEMVHPDFVWIHNHGVTIEESKAALIGKREEHKAFLQSSLGREYSGPPPGADRKQEAIKVLVEGETAVAYGITIVVKPDRFVEHNPDKERETIYRFMRTYVKKEGQWWLLSNQTMAIPQRG